MKTEHEIKIRDHNDTDSEEELEPRVTKEHELRMRATSGDRQDASQYQSEEIATNGQGGQHEDEVAMDPYHHHKVRFTSELITSVGTRPRTLTADKATLYWTASELNNVLKMEKAEEKKKHRSRQRATRPPPSTVRQHKRCAYTWPDDEDEDVSTSPKAFRSDDFSYDQWKNSETSGESGPHLLGSLWDSF